MTDLPSINKPEKTSRLRARLICLCLILVTVIVYWPVCDFEFINMDDPIYVVKSPVIQSGLSWANFKWAFQSHYAGNWHPLTALSHMLDCQLFGLNAGPHHLTNLFFHLLNTLLLFALLRHVTGALWRSAMVAALFALHPLHVESVAWVSERKDVLSGFFFLLTVWAYARYADAKIRHSPFLNRHYLLALLFFTLGLLSKPMLVTLPFVLLLLDFWPLNRLKFSPFDIRNLKSVILEKLPFFALAAALSVVTFLVQKSEGAVLAIEKLPLAPRLSNALVSYVQYLSKTVWPESLAPFYTYVVDLSAWQVGGAVVLLAGISALTIWQFRRRQFLFVGWFWFLGMLVPVIGLVQVGSQSMADRYTYLPHIGLFIALVWLVSDGAPAFNRLWASGKQMPERNRLGWSVAFRRACAVGVGFLLLACLVVSSLQVRFWQNSETLFRHAIAVTRDNYPAYNNLGTALDELGRYDEAEKYFQTALEIKPDYAEAHFNLSLYWGKKGDMARSKEHLEAGLSSSPNNARAHYNLANILYQQNNVAEALDHYAAALRINPDYTRAHNNLAAVLLKLGRYEEAISHFRAALQNDPDSADALNNLAGALIEAGRPRESLPHLRRALQVSPDFADACLNLGSAFLALGEWRGATEQFAVALKINPDLPMAHFKSGEAFFRAGKTNEALAQYEAALQLNPDLPESHYQAAVILGVNKNIAPAVAHFKEAIRLKPDWIEPLNNLAWILATCPDEKFRDGKRAAELAERACALTENKNPGTLDTLAAAYAEGGEFSKAINAAEKAADLALAVGQTAMAGQIASRLELYRAQRPFHE